MNISLSILLPVRNAEQGITDQVEWLLDQAADLTSQFEVLVIDDGSTDQTEEIVCQLLASYPQVRCKRFGKQQGAAAAISLAMPEARGEIIILQDLKKPLSNSDLRALWAMHLERIELKQSKLDQLNTLPMPVIPQPLDQDLMDRLTKWGAGIQEAEKFKGSELDTKAKVRRPNFLKDLKNFALGE